MRDKIKSVQDEIAMWKKIGLYHDDPKGFRNLQIKLLRLKMAEENVK